jgi:N,N'-diacetyllegionaminate synthase
MSTLIIAEAGVNHNGDMDIAKRLIDTAKSAQADIVKFQTAVSCTSKYAPKAEYQKRETGEGGTQLEMAKKLRLTLDQHMELYEYCRGAGIQYLSTPFDIESVDFLSSLDLPFLKIPSGEVTNLPYLLRIGRTRKPIVMSTGMSETDEIRSAVGILRDNGGGPITLLQCHTDYPTAYRNVNLRAMVALREEFKLPVGLSDHSPGIEAPIAAVAMGASVIEKHFTLDRSMRGPDHKASIEPDELAAMVRSIRNIELALGDGVKRCTEEERKNIIVARKSIVAKRAIRKGEALSEENITTKRPGNGISPMSWFSVLGTLAVRDFGEDELIEL